MWRYSIVLIAIIAGGYTQVLRNGPCPEVKSVPNLNNIKLEKLMGMWYEQIHTTRWSGMEIECNMQFFSMNSANNFSYDSFSYSPTLDREFYENGNIEVLPYHSSNDGNFVLDIEGDDELSNVFLLGTDYTRYTTLFTCTPSEDNLHYENVLIFTRNRRPKPDTLVDALRPLAANNLTEQYLQPTKQRLCPDFNTTQPENNMQTSSMAPFPSSSPTTMPPVTTMATKMQPTVSTMRPTFPTYTFPTKKSR